MTQPVIEKVVRESYGRLVAYLASRSRDVQLVEDALSEALIVALKEWPVQGVPDSPEAWLLTVARRRLVDARRKADREEAAWQGVAEMMRSAEAAKQEGGFPDERVKLLFVCAHPALDESVRAPLMLSLLFGLTAEEIAGSFLVSPATMGQRLVRAKQRIQGLKLKFDVPEGDRLEERLGSVLDAIYVAYGVSWEEPGEGVRGLGEEALQMAEIVVRMFPEEGEGRGLLALILYLKSRDRARRDEWGQYVPLSEQVVDLWDRELILQAENELKAAVRLGKLGRFQWEASIQSVHVSRLWRGATDWESLCVLYDELMHVHCSAGVCVGRAAARGEAFGASEGLRCLGELDEAELKGYQPYWATKGHLLEQAGERDEARNCYQMAIQMAGNEAVQEWLRRRLES